jgi:hypothetical protein
MTTFAGEFLQLGPGRLTPKNLSSDVTGATAITSLSASLSSASKNASRGTPQPAISISAPAPNIGQIEEAFGGRLFYRIITVPTTEALQFVLTATQFPVEVWNTFQDSDEILETITITGSGGLTLSDPFGEPLLFAAQGSRIYQALVPSSGPTQIDQSVIFAFLSGINGLILVTGSRIALFSVQPDWSEGIAESISYLTDVLKAYSDNEQRRGLRQFPRRALRYRALALNARDAAGMESLVWGWQHEPYGVPWWPDATPVTADTPAGSFSIPCNTVDRQFAAGGLCCIFSSEFVFEALTVESVSPTGVTFTSPTQLDWKANPSQIVMPVFLARLGSSVNVSRFSSEIDQIDLDFIGEALQAAPAPSTTLTQYKGFDVLEIAPNWRDAPLKRTYTRSLVTVDPKIGPITVIDKGGSAIVKQPFPWFLTNHAAVTTFRAFLLRRFGQLNPFWLPTWDQDLILAFDVGSGDTGIVIKSEFYSRFFFPNPARRFIAFIPTDGSSNVYRKITSTNDNGDGTESLVLDTPTGKNFPAASTMISFLTLARCASDDNQIEWLTADLAEVNLEVQEVPRELPA